MRVEFRTNFGFRDLEADVKALLRLITSKKEK
jgi:hypothetical protein